jgi:hypothetical protein
MIRFILWGFLAIFRVDTTEDDIEIAHLPFLVRTGFVRRAKLVRWTFILIVVVVSAVVALIEVIVGGSRNPHQS